MEIKKNHAAEELDERPPSRSPSKLWGTPGFTRDLCRGAASVIKLGGAIIGWEIGRLGSSRLLNLSNRRASMSCVDLFAATCCLSPSSMFWSLSASIALISSVGSGVDSRGKDRGEQGAD